MRTLVDFEAPPVCVCAEPHLTGGCRSCDRKHVPAECRTCHRPYKPEVPGFDACREAWQRQMEGNRRCA